MIEAANTSLKHNGPYFNILIWVVKSKIDSNEIGYEGCKNLSKSQWPLLLKMSLGLFAVNIARNTIGN